MGNRVIEVALESAEEAGKGSDMKGRVPTT